MKKFLALSLLLTLAYALLPSPEPASVTVAPAPAATGPETGIAAETQLANAYRNQVSNLQVEGGGVVMRVLSDDNDGSRHQRFILRLSSGQTLLVAHNIDLAPRLSALREGDSVAFFGEYEWNDQGGVIHWTHRDPGRRHVAGWLRHGGRLYQ